MSPRTKSLLAVAGAGAALVVAPAGAQAATLVVKGGVVMKPGKAMIDNMRFAPLRSTVSPGETVNIRNRTGQPHTVSIVKRSALPRTAKQADAFYESPLMGQFMQAHEVDPENEDAPPGKALVDVGKEGFDQAGDSVFFAGARESFKATAAAGKSLSYICLLHPWMQGTLRTK
jgi:plastocyanin